MTGKTPASWIAVDWGTTHLRAWAMDEKGDPVHEARSDAGMGGLEPGRFEPALLDLAGDWLKPDTCTTVIACGMVGARQGWIEADYVAVPAAPLTPGLFREAPATDARIRVLIVPGLKQADPPDVMRGEETQIAGLASSRPGFDGVICLPGTHSKWVRISNGRVARFRTFMTGELFSLLAERSILRHSVGPQGKTSFDLDAFDGALAACFGGTASDPNLFEIRAADILNGVPPATGRARLSARLIAHEIEAARPYWQGRETLVLGGSGLAALYVRALGAAGGKAEALDGAGLTLAGLVAAHRLVEDKADA